jgi:hypothetical protein
MRPGGRFDKDPRPFGAYCEAGLLQGKTARESRALGAGNREPENRALWTADADPPDTAGHDLFNLHDRAFF